MGLATALGLGRWQAGSPGSWLTSAVPILIVQLLLLNNINAMRIVSEHTSWCTIGAIGVFGAQVLVAGRFCGGVRRLLQPPRAWSSELAKNHPSWQCCQNKFRFRRRNPPAESGSNHDKVPCKKMCPRGKQIGKERALNVFSYSPAQDTNLPHSHMHRRGAGNTTRTDTSGFGIIFASHRPGSAIRCFIEGQQFAP